MPAVQPTSHGEYLAFCDVFPACHDVRKGALRGSPSFQVGQRASDLIIPSYGTFKSAVVE